MQLVINIDEVIYKRILPYKDLPIISNLCNDYPEITHAIANGVPLPKGHGKIIDSKEVYKFARKRYPRINSDDGMYRGAVATALRYTTAIIEADDDSESEEP